MSATAIVGLGVSGLSCLRHLHGQEPLVVVDSRPQPPQLAVARRDFPDVEFRLGAVPGDWQGIGRLVLSPGVAPDDELLAGSEHLPRTSDIDLFVTAARAPIIGITGTNGKSTVTALLGHLLRRLGVQVAVGGNLGQPALDLLASEVQVYVLELSSFQLEHAAPIPLVAATVLNVTPDHLDRHGTLAHYARVKRGIYANAAAVVANADDALTAPRTNERVAGGAYRSIAFGVAASAAYRLLGGNRLLLDGVERAMPVNPALAGRHNQLNLLAALALLAAAQLPQLTQVPRALGSTAQRDRTFAAAADFAGLPHRCEFVAERAGVQYVNDSKATNVGACVAALEGLGSGTGSCHSSPRIILLAGGVGKGADFTALASVAARYVKSALLFGADAPAIQAAIAGATATEPCESLSAAVTRAAELAAVGDIVLLAPACASFDMFADFADRGMAFRRCVEALA